MMPGPSERAGFIEAPVIGPPNIASRPTVPPTAIAAASPTARVSVATANDHEHEEEGEDRLPEERLAVGAARVRGADVGDVAERAAKDRRSDEGSDELRAPVERYLPAWEVPRQCERERHGRVEMGARDVSDGIDHGHDHEPERDRHADVAERARLLVDHDRAAAGEDERERPDRLGDQDARQGKRSQLSE